MNNHKKAWEVFLVIASIVLVILLVYVVYKVVILPAPEQVQKIQPGTNADVLEKLGPRTAVALIFAMIALMALVFWLFITFGRRLSMRGYLGPLARDAIARAEIARQEDSLREDLRYGKIPLELKPGSNEFTERYRIPQGDNPPNLTPGITIDEAGRILEYSDSWGTGTGGPGGNRRPGGYDPYDGEKRILSRFRPEELQSWTADRLKTEREASKPEEADDDTKKKQKADTMNLIQEEIIRRFRQGYRQEQMNAFYERRGKITADERDRAEKLLPTMDVSSFGGGWVFVLEFTTILFIVFAVLSLGLLGVLKSEPIATILAAIAGYVLGKSTSIRGAGGEEIRRGAEEPKVLFEAMTKQEEIRSLRDEEKIKLQREVDELQRKLAQSKVTVPGVIGSLTSEAENKIKEKNLVPDKKELETSEGEPGKVFHQSPEANAEVAKGSSVLLFIAKKPKTSGDR